MYKVRAKKHLGQHFLTDLNIAQQTVDAFNAEQKFSKTLEVGPGMGVLTNILLERSDLDLHIVDIDRESIAFLKEKGKLPEDKIIESDFLQMDLSQLFGGEAFGIIGNFPYNISTQILFKALEYKDRVIEVVGMFQKEVAERIASPEGSKVYGITSVLLQAYFNIDYLFTVNEDVFDPPPKVKSAVIRLRRNDTFKLNCNEKRFTSIVKMAFNQRRKTMRNSLKSLIPEELKAREIFNKRPEQLSVNEFVELTNLLENNP
jgi:16S rRNA (adenine1518-N6/adenine1519-N6)-dimethyltransferase